MHKHHGRASGGAKGGGIFDISHMAKVMVARFRRGIFPKFCSNDVRQTVRTDKANTR